MLASAVVQRNRLAEPVKLWNDWSLGEGPSSQHSQKTTAVVAIKKLLTTPAERDVYVIVTFPDHECSNGIDASMIKSTASKMFKVKTHRVSNVFSTLGGPASKTHGPRFARLIAVT